MLVDVIGFDPSLRNWGAAKAKLDLETGVLSTPVLHLIQTGEEPKSKQVRMNSYDLQAAMELSSGVFSLVQNTKFIFVEVPHGSQSAASMKGYGICIGILGALKSTGIPIIEVSESESKKIFCNKRTATKEEMINQAFQHYPDANWPKHAGKISATKAEHMADAIAAIHAGVQTPLFLNLLKLYAKV